MGRGRPRKPQAVRELEGNRSKRDIPADLPLHGIPECPDHLTGRAREHFNFVAAELTPMGVTKRLDTEGLAVLASLWELYWACVDAKDVDGACKVVARWGALGGKYSLFPSDRAKLLVGQPKPDETEERFFKVTG